MVLAVAIILTVGQPIAVGSSDSTTNYSAPETADQYLIGHGLGNLAKGMAVCRRMADLSARADVAKQIRVLVTEHMTDRIRERTGRTAEQDIEIIREEKVRELLRGIRIVEHTVDREAGTCASIAVMPKHWTARDEKSFYKSMDESEIIISTEGERINNPLGEASFDKPN
jgi:hypothetical protein